MDTNVKIMVANNYAEVQHMPKTLKAAFAIAEEMSVKMFEAQSFECTSTYRLPRPLILYLPLKN